MTRNRNWIAIALVGVVAAGAGFVARGAIAGDEPAAVKPIDGHALVKAVMGSWTIKATSTSGAVTGQIANTLECGKTVLASRYTQKFGTDEVHGLGVLQISADGKTATQWVFDSMMEGTLMMTGPVTDTGYTIEGSNKMGSSKMTLAKTATGFEVKTFSNGELFMTETYTKAK